jgi:hypothetical protein
VKHIYGKSSSLLRDPGVEALSPEEVHENVAQYLNRPGDFDWYFHPAVPLEKLRSLDNGTGPSNDSTSGWRSWMAKEREMSEDELGYDPWGEDFTHWLTTGGSWERDTAVVATEQRGHRPGFGVEDGNHRLAVAHEQGMTTLPAYLGVRK